VKDHVELDGKTYAISEVELHIVLDDGTSMMYMAVAAKGKAGGFGLWEVELPQLKSIDGLDGKRIHVRPDGECYDDDTLGTDMVGAYAATDLNYWGSKNGPLVYGDILVDFTRIEGRTFRVKIKMTLADAQDHPADLPPEAFSHSGCADFVVTLDENNPYEE
jgi:hypothetical protein